MRRWVGLVVILVTSARTAGVPGDREAGKVKSAPCGGCHGVDGSSPNAEWPKVATQHSSYLVEQLHDFRTGRRRNAIMEPLSPTSPRRVTYGEES